MKQFIEDFIDLISDNFPSLDGKIQHGAVDAETQPPFAAYTIPEEQPIRSFHGIIGYRTTFDLTIIGQTLSEVTDLKMKIIKVVEKDEINGKRCRLEKSQTEFFPDYDFDGILLTFKIL